MMSLISFVKTEMSVKSLSFPFHLKLPFCSDGAKYVVSFSAELFLFYVSYHVCHREPNTGADAEDRDTENADFVDDVSDFFGKTEDVFQVTFVFL